MIWQTRHPVRRATRRSGPTGLIGRFAFLLALLLLPAWSVRAFSSGAASCGPPPSQFHGFESAGTGGFSFTPTIDGQPVTEAHPGQTVRVTLSRATPYKGFLVRVNEGTPNGPFVSGLAVTDPSNQQIEIACSPLGSAATQLFDGVSDRTLDELDWTVPIETTPGTQIVLSAIPVVTVFEWYGGSGSPIQQTLTITEAPPAVPASGPMARWILVGVLGATAFGIRELARVRS